MPSSSHSPQLPPYALIMFRTSDMSFVVTPSVATCQPDLYLIGFPFLRVSPPLFSIFLNVLMLIIFYPSCNYSISHFGKITMGRSTKNSRPELCNLYKQAKCGARRFIARRRMKKTEVSSLCLILIFSALSRLFQGTSGTPYLFFGHKPKAPCCPTLLVSTTLVRGFHCSSKPLSHCGNSPLPRGTTTYRASPLVSREVPLTLTPRPPNRLSRSIPEGFPPAEGISSSPWDNYSIPHYGKNTIDRMYKKPRPELCKITNKCNYGTSALKASADVPPAPDVIHRMPLVFGRFLEEAGGFKTALY